MPNFTKGQHVQIRMHKGWVEAVYQKHKRGHKHVVMAAHGRRRFTAVDEDNLKAIDITPPPASRSKNMQTVIRNGVFETNSSSTHSICIADPRNFIIDSLLVDEAGKLQIFGGEFGWGYEHHNDAATKASYCLVHAKSRQVPGQDREEMLRKAIAEFTGAKEIEFVPVTRKGETKWSAPAEEDEWGYIDHQSIEDSGGAGEPVWESIDTLKNFIFNRNSQLTIDNDNK